ncbi:MAG TPA: phosphoribosylanthranilate isomerase [Bacteroidales bacterium]|nr:phosphoribosylanthranilate isomerase [Bacteroidales bacterium]
MLKIKVCGMTDPLNTRDIVKVSPDFIGFIFYPGSVRYVGKKPDESLFKAIPQGILKTGVFVNEDIPVIIDLKKRYELDMIQLHGNEPAEYCNSLHNAGLTVIKAFGINDSFDFAALENYTDACNYFLFDTKTDSRGGSGLKFNWKKIGEYKLEKPFFLSGGIGPDDISSLKQLNHKSFFAVDINSRFEVRPGIKDRSKIEKFINAIKK